MLFSSSAARIGLANHEAIAAAKAGVVGLTLAAGDQATLRRMSESMQLRRTCPHALNEADLG